MTLKQVFGFAYWYTNHRRCEEIEKGSESGVKFWDEQEAEIEKLEEHLIAAGITKSAKGK